MTLIVTVCSDTFDSDSVLYGRIIWLGQKYPSLSFKESVS